MSRALAITEREGPLPELITPEALAAQTGWSERRLREIARGLGACRIIGNRMLLTKTDVDAILEASRPCPSNSTDAAKSGTTVAPLPVGGYEALRKLREKTEPRKSPQPERRGNGKVLTMARNRS